MNRTNPAKAPRAAPRVTGPDAEERALDKFNRLVAKAAPRAARETAAALGRFHRDIATAIRRAG